MAYLSSSVRWSSERDAVGETDARQPLEIHRVRTFGGFEVSINGVEITRWQAGRARALFQFLLTHADVMLSKETLIEAIWGESNSRSPETSLKVAIYTLRRILDKASNEAGVENARPFRIVSGNGGYQLVVENTRIDFQEFRAAVDRGRHLERLGREAQACDQYRRAVGIYLGPYLQDCKDSWAILQRERLQDDFLHAMDRLSTAAERMGDYESVILLNQRMLEIDPCREESYCALMRCHARKHQLARVRDWYGVCVQQFRTHLGMEPDKRTTRVFHAAIRGRLDPIAATGDGR